MGQPILNVTLNGVVTPYVIATDAYLEPRGLSNPRLISYPRTVGGIIEESGILEQSLLLHCYMIGNPLHTRTILENMMHELNEIVGPVGSQGDIYQYSGSLSVNGNTYNNVYIKTITYGPVINNVTIQYTIEFILADQNTGNQFNNTGSTINQLSCSGLKNFSRGRKMTFTTQLSDGTFRTFNFWHNFDNLKHYETYLVIKHSFSYGGHARVIKVGGFEKIVCDGWLADDDCPRQFIEAYFYNMINGPLGRIGTLVVDNSQTITNAFLQYVTTENTPRSACKYQLIFIASLQC